MNASRIRISVPMGSNWEDALFIVVGIVVIRMLMSHDIQLIYHSS